MRVFSYWKASSWLNEYEKLTIKENRLKNMTISPADSAALLDTILQQRLPSSFYNRNTLTVAKELLGKLLVSRTRDGDIVARITEVEAYRGSDDPASHAYKKETPRNRLMFGPAGFAYIYFVYGNHYCLNVTTEKKGSPGAVLIRSVDIIQGIRLAQRNRTTKSAGNLSNGPGKLTQALRIDKRQNGLDLTTSTDLFICLPMRQESLDVAVSTRVGVKNGCDKLWRFYLKKDESASTP
jgi:DNA-3-methyladenine glycosylase